MTLLKPGTYVNDERIAKGDPTELRVGDVISLTKPHPPGAKLKDMNGSKQ